MEKENPIVSIIIPIYNMQNYIDECIESILVQTFKSWELVIIDDGSTDDSLSICVSYAKKEKRIKVIHQENAGVSVARNVGIKVSVGTYIVFVDADDILPAKSIECRVSLMEHSDMGIAGYECFGEDTVLEEKMPKCTRLFWNRKDAIENILLSGEIGYQGYLWNKIFLRLLIIKNEIWFQNGILYNEDRLFVIHYVMHCNKIRLTDNVVYYYRRNPNGAMGGLKTMKDENYDRVMTEFEAYSIMCNMMNQYDINLYYKCAENAMYRALNLYQLVDKREKCLRRALWKKIKEYGFFSFQGDFSLMKKIKILGHILLRR